MSEKKSERLDPKLVVELKAKHGDTLTAIRALSGWLVVRPATRGEYERYQDKVAADRSGVRRHTWELAQSCIVHPGPQGLTDAIDREPAILLSHVGPAIHGMAGDDREPETEKL